MKLTAESVEQVFLDCLFRDDEIVDGKPKTEPVEVEGIIQIFGFHPIRLNEHKNEIIELLQELPKEFFKDSGGWSFLNACIDEHGNQWGEHWNTEQLLCLGIGLGIAKFQFPRSMWSAFPGEMPYVTVLMDRGIKDD